MRALLVVNPKATTTSARSRDVLVRALRSAVDLTVEYTTRRGHAATLARAKIKQRSSLYSIIESFSGLGKLDLLASFALFDNDPGRLSRLEAEFDKVTPALIQRTAREYLRTGNRTVYTIVPGAEEAAQ